MGMKTGRISLTAVIAIALGMGTFEMARPEDRDFLHGAQANSTLEQITNGSKAPADLFVGFRNYIVDSDDILVVTQEDMNEWADGGKKPFHSIVTQHFEKLVIEPYENGRIQIYLNENVVEFPIDVPNYFDLTAIFRTPMEGNFISEYTTPSFKEDISHKPKYDDELPFLHAHFVARLDSGQVRVKDNWKKKLADRLKWLPFVNKDVPNLHDMRYMMAIGSKYVAYFDSEGEILGYIKDDKLRSYELEDLELEAKKAYLDGMVAIRLDMLGRTEEITSKGDDNFFE